jgi:hypothetical protein
MKIVKSIFSWVLLILALGLAFVSFLLVTGAADPKLLREGGTEFYSCSMYSGRKYTVCKIILEFEKVALEQRRNKLEFD